MPPPTEPFAAASTATERAMRTPSPRPPVIAGPRRPRASEGAHAASAELQLIQAWSLNCPPDFMPVLADRASAIAARPGARRAAAAYLARRLRHGCRD